MRTKDACCKQCHLGCMANYEHLKHIMYIRYHPIVVAELNLLQTLLQGYYKRTPDYFPILLREKVGCFEVPMVHSTYLVDLRQPVTKGLRYFPPFEEYHGEIDDILLFAYSARKAGRPSFSWTISYSFNNLPQKQGTQKLLILLGREF